MGCDGGTIPRRDELVRVKKKPEQKDKDAEREFRWLHCALTQQRLQEPVVMCGLGRLYSKQNVIELLLEKEKMPAVAQHIKSMKDIRTLNLTPNPAYTEEDKTEGLLDTRHAPYICKLIGLEMTGRFRFVALWSCGCVMSERALKQLKSTAGTCPLCQMPFGVEDVIVLNGGDEDVELMQVKIAMRSAKRKASKKDKKDAKCKDKEKKLDVTATVTTNGETVDVPVLEPAKGEEEEEPTTSKAAMASSDQKIGTDLSNGEATSNAINTTKSKLKVVANPMKRLGAGGSDPMQDPELKRLKTDYSVAKDPKATDVYKSLFTTHKSEQEQTRAHWVTYNPFYN